MFFGKSKKKAVSQPHRSANNDKFIEAQALVKKGENISYAVWKTGLNPTNGQMLNLRSIEYERNIGWMYQD